MAKTLKKWQGWLLFGGSMVVVFLLGLLVSSLMERRAEVASVFNNKRTVFEDSIVAQWAKEEQAGAKLNTAYFEGGQWKNYYSNKLQGDGTPYVRRFTYAMSRGPLQDRIPARKDQSGRGSRWNRERGSRRRAKQSPHIPRSTITPDIFHT